LTTSEIRRVMDVLPDAYSLCNRHAFTTRMLRVVTQVIPADIATHFTIDRRTCSFTSTATPVGADDFPGSGDVFRCCVSEHPLFVNFSRVRDGSAHKISDFLTRRQLHRLALYNEYYRRIGTEYQMAMALPGRKDAIVGIALSRNRRDCSERDRTLLNVLSPHLWQAYVSAETVSRLEARIGRVQEAAGSGDQELVVVADGPSTFTATARGRRWLSTYFGGSTRQCDRLPEAVRRWMVRETGRLALDDDMPAARQPLVAHRDGHQLEIRLAGQTEETILLLRERSTGVRAEELAALGLSRRETDVLAWVAQGKTNPEIGSILGMSGRTVGKHLERIYQKLGVETRTAAAAVAHEGTVHAR
jgi:DNA-binding CsgD family transcriptional regulator